MGLAMGVIVQDGEEVALSIPMYPKNIEKQVIPDSRISAKKVAISVSDLTQYDE